MNVYEVWSIDERTDADCKLVVVAESVSKALEIALSRVDKRWPKEIVSIISISKGSTVVIQAAS